MKRYKMNSQSDNRNKDTDQNTADQKIQKVLVAGRGSVGLTEGIILQKALGDESFAFLADPSRVERYRNTPLFIDGKPADFSYVSSPEEFGKADLILIASKYGALQEVMDEIEPFVTEDTILMPAINGIVSEEDLRKRFCRRHVIRTIAQKMDSVYDGRNMNHSQTGELVFGADLEGQTEDIEKIRELFERAKLPYVCSEDILYDQWNKLMLNCGINEVCAAYGATYGDVMTQPDLFELFMKAMEEVRQTAAACGIEIRAEELEKWADAIRHLGKDAMPSMAQDVRAGRPTELSLFAGTVIPLAHEHGLDVPVLEQLYSAIHAMEEKNRSRNCG